MEMKDWINSIEVIDDFFEESTRNEVFTRLKRPKWSLEGGTIDNRFWHMNELEYDEYFSCYLFSKISQKLGDRTKNYCVSRIYANGQTAGQCGSAHPDDGDLTFLYYPNPEWNYEWQGHLIFLDPDKNPRETKNYEPEKIVGYKSNRAVIFPAKIFHHADAPSRYFNGLRISLAYKFKELGYD
jgi:hypothetical protein